MEGKRFQNKCVKHTHTHTHARNYIDQQQNATIQTHLNIQTNLYGKQYGFQKFRKMMIVIENWICYSKIHNNNKLKFRRLHATRRPKNRVRSKCSASVSWALSSWSFVTTLKNIRWIRVIRYLYILCFFAKYASSCRTPEVCSATPSEARRQFYKNTAFWKWDFELYVN